MRTGSRPESGSSNMTIAGSSTSARAKPARLRIPPESSFGIFSSASARPDLAQAAVDDLADLVLALVGVLAQREGDVVEDVHRAEQGAVLEQQAELLAHLEQLVVGHVRDRLAVDEHVARVRVEQPDDVLDQHRLAGSRRAEHHRDLVVGQAEVEAVEDPRAAELLDHVDDLDRVLATVVALLAGVPAVGVGLRSGRRRGSSSPCAGRRARGRAPRSRSSLVAGADLVGEAVVLGLLRGHLRPRAASAATCSSRRDPRSSSVRPLVHRLPFRPQPPIGALGLAPQKTSVPIIPMMCTRTMFSTIDFAVAVPTPTGPPEAV